MIPRMEQAAMPLSGLQASWLGIVLGLAGIGSTWRPPNRDDGRHGRTAVMKAGCGALEEDQGKVGEGT